MKFSIIIPIYNVEKYLDKCLKSIISQIDVQDEIILINDASTDNSLLICKEYIRKYTNITLVDNKINKGIGYVRNIGLKYATGDYILWIDSDDWISNECLSVIKKYLEKTNTDILIFDYTEVENGIYRERTYRKKSEFVSKREIMLDVSQDIFYSYLCRTVIKRELYKNIKFPEKVSMMEDFCIYHELFYKAKTFFYLKESLYFYRILKTSLSHKKQKDCYGVYKIYLKREEFIRKNCSYIKEKYRMLPAIIYACSLSNANYLSKEEKVKIGKLIRKNIIFILSRKNISNKKKFQLLLYMISPSLLSFVRKMLNK